MARASVTTRLSLDRWAAIMGIPPCGFNSAIASAAFPLGGACADVWWQYDWQSSDKVSRESLARALSDAEGEIARALGWWPGLRWTAHELHPWPRHYQREVLPMGGWNVQGRAYSVQANWGKIAAPGRRASTFLGTVGPVYTDADGDGFAETATVTIPTTVTDIREIRFYHPGHTDADEWEIRPARLLSANGIIAVARFWTWQLLLESLWEAFPGPDGAMEAINAQDAANRLAAVNCYRVYNDPSQAATQFIWEPDLTSAPQTIAETTQLGTLLIRNAEGGEVIPYPATCSGGVWSEADWAAYAEPDRVCLWYQHGGTDARYDEGQVADSIPDWLAHPIAWLATSRLERPLCSCGPATALAADLRVDLAALPPNGQSYSTTEEILNCPFGTRKGEVQAWRRMAKFAESRMGGATV